MSTTPHKKHPCPDCQFCQWCGDDRCHLCRGKTCRHGKKLSLAEQIARFEEVNRQGQQVGAEEPRSRDDERP
jgi:hypothetical protein